MRMIMLRYYRLRARLEDAFTRLIGEVRGKKRGEAPRPQLAWKSAEQKRKAAELASQLRGGPARAEELPEPANTVVELNPLEEETRAA